MFDRATLALARLKHPVMFAGALLALWFLGETLLYRSGLYYWLAEPESNTGAVQNALMRLDRACDSDGPSVLVMGDSRIGEGFSPTLAKGDGKLGFVDYHVPGSTPRTWYYLLREAIRRDCRFDAVLVGLPYTPRILTPLADWPLDPSHQAPLTGLRDLPDYPSAPASAEMRSRAWRTLLLPSLVMQDDTRQLLGDPRQRAEKLLRHRPGYLNAVGNYAGRDETMPPVLISPSGEVTDYAGADDWQRGLIDGHLRELRTPLAPAVAEGNPAYYARWLPAMARLAQARGVPLVVFPLPRGPYRVVLPDEAHPLPAEAALSGVDNAVVLPHDLFHELEDPAYFFDVLHANRAGREILSTRLGERLRALLHKQNS